MAGYVFQNGDDDAYIGSCNSHFEVLDLLKTR